ncbi:ribosome recycling factor [Heliomicrobium modesticaldum Ice1]|uniref:Ribosome-recycling factor n=1 Tax=Heliobacterium modesticaldum (strain ATCC 51547 / Ice1) TaxID=498761 RepID=RRF_HELMI|nr:ribosome recycling factor [Heliomicrobium modesticaldum]B0THE0.1 RecName: Full=Ribosome-recycling factor; Short=RRF; AltName: Full=Ribosome-releasing factor [Heliomicrobium modesticaldum Ice1]ABZ84815.1 ribosome recycling factor [Heliomicrobium modesticaldum Ice1]
MINEIKKETEDKMKKTVEALRKEYQHIRAGRANPALLEKVTVEYYGAPTPVNQLANISAPEARLLVIQPWDKSVLPALEKAILKSDLGLTPTSDGAVIRLVIPQLTQERRSELVKTVKKRAEEHRVILRNLRRDANEDVKDLQKEHIISEDEGKRAQEEIQKLTDKYIREVDQVAERKEAEIMEV